jgi:hypothetical protein
MRCCAVPTQAGRPERRTAPSWSTAFPEGLGFNQAGLLLCLPDQSSPAASVFTEARRSNTATMATARMMTAKQMTLTTNKP